MREIKHLSIHQWLRSAIPGSQQPTSPIGFLFLKLPPPPCAVLLVGYKDIKFAMNRSILEMRQRLYSGLSDDFASENRWKTFKGKPEPEIHVFYHGFYHGFYLKYRVFL